MNPNRDKAMTEEDWAADRARRAEEVARDPQLREMAKANQYTTREQSDLVDAEAAVLETEAAYSRAGIALNEARTAGFLDRETADLDFLKQDLTEARLAHEHAIRRRAMLRLRADAARAARRRAAKVKFAPKVAPAPSFDTSRGLWWGDVARLTNRKDAA